jgi:hypothetical protein
LSAGINKNLAITEVLEAETVLGDEFPFLAIPISER